MTLQESPHERSLQTWPRPDGAGSAPPEPAPFIVPALGPDAIGPEPAVRKRRSLVPRTLTARLVTGVVGLVIFVVATTGVGTYWFLHGFLYDRLDQQVSAQGGQMVGSVIGSISSGRCDPTAQSCRISDNQRFGGPSNSDHNQFVVILSPSGDVRSSVAPGSTVQALNLTDAQRTQLTQASTKPRTVTTTDGSDVRITVIQQPGFVVVSGISTGEVEGTLYQLVRRELFVGGLGVVLAFVLSAAGLSLGLGPLKRVTRTAQEVTAELSADGGGLDRRVPEMDSTTEVGQLATSFNTMLDTVEREFTARRESEERMRQFLADASHELRTPLTSIRGYAELARMQRARRAPGAPDDSEDTLGRIESEGTRMSRLVEDLLILARADDTGAEAPAAVRDLIEVDGLIGDAIDGVAAAHPTRLIQREVEPGLQLIGDRDQILRVLRNLTTNAAIHTDSAGAIRLTGRREGDTVVLQVIDQGPGLAPDEAAHVFERFWRADKARTRVRGGSGLGMAIVAQIVAAHGGHVYFDSDVVRGSTVTVVLPDRLAGGVAGQPSEAR